MIAPAVPQSSQNRPVERPLPMRMRLDLEVRRQAFQRRAYVVVKDPLALRYFRLQEEEFAILQWLDGTRSLEQLKADYEREFLPQQVSTQEIWQFISSLHQNGLVIADTQGQGTQLLTRGTERQRKEFWSKFTNLLAIRFRGTDPDRFLAFLLPAVSWMFSPLAVVLCLAVMLSALLLVTVEFQTFQARLPAFHHFFSLGNSAWLIATMVFAKVIHELGHGLTCKRYGGECHELGLILLVFTPSLYCNVSDSWLLPSKWHRVLISAAGMYVELLLASLCTFLWWFSQEGLFNHMCLNLMFVCSVSTLVFNANPLMRFDGYYILADISEIPNLSSKASRVLIRNVSRWCLGIQPQGDPQLPTRWRPLFAAYAIASVVYRWVITFSILYFLLKVFEPYDLQPLGHLLILMALVKMIGGPLWRLGKYFSVPGRVEQMKRKHLLVTVAVLNAVIVVATVVPFPHFVTCECTIKPHDAEPVYVQTPGVLHENYVKAGQRITAGENLAKLVNLELAEQVLALDSELAQQQTQLKSLLQLRYVQPDALAAESQMREAIATLEKQLHTKRHDINALMPAAPRDGIVLFPESVSGKPQVEGQLPQWSGYPLESQNRGTYLEAGVLLCHIGEGRQWQAILKIDSGDVEFVQQGQKVQLMLEQQPGKVWTGHISVLAHLEVSHPAASHLGDKSLEPVGRTYFATVVLDDPRQELRAGLSGQAKITTAPRTLFTRVTRWLSQTFSQ